MITNIMPWKRSRLSKWTWKCPHIFANGEKCSRRGRKPMRNYRAGRYGRYHLRKVHKDFVSEPDLIKI